MTPPSNSVPARYMRGGTSKGLFLDPAVLPNAGPDRDALLAALIGSPDPYGRQLDGLGAATSSTSKVCLVARSNRVDADVDFTFGHIDIASGQIDYSGNCGNLSAAVGVYAIEAGLITPVPPVTKVRVWQTNLARHLAVHVPVTGNGDVISRGDTQIAGVPRCGAEIKVDFLLPGYDDAGHVLPTGETVTEISDGTSKIEASLVHAGNATVFVRARDLGLSGSELPATIEDNTEVKTRLENLRCAGAVAMGLGENDAWVHQHRPATPKIALVAPPAPYTTSDGTTLSEKQIDIRSRIMSMGLAHHTYTGTGAIAIAVAARIPGTLVQECTAVGGVLRIGHPAGVLPAAAEMRPGKRPVALSARLFRTARTLMVGEVPLP